MMSFTSVAIELNNSAVNMYNSNRYGEAVLMFNDALSAIKASWEDDHCKTACEDKRTEYNDTGNNKYGKKTKLSFSEPLHITMGNIDTVDSICAVILYNLGIIRMKEGSLEKACEFFKTSLSFVPLELDEESIEAMICISIHRYLSLISYDKGRKDEALKLIKDAYYIGRDAFGDHELVAFILTTLAQMFLQSGSLLEAEMAFNEASRVFTQHGMNMAKGMVSSECTINPGAKAA